MRQEMEDDLPQGEGKHILFLLSTDLTRQGPSVHLLTPMIGEVLAAGASVTVIMKDGGGTERLPPEWEGNPRFRCERIPADDRHKGSFALRYLDDYRYAGRCAGIYRRLPPVDAVFLQSSNVAYEHISRIRRLLRCPVLFNVQDIFPCNLTETGMIGKKNPLISVLRKRQSRSYGLADRIVTISPDMKETLLREGAPEDRLSVIYNWSYADTPITLSRNDCPLFAGDDPKTFRAVYAGNVGRMQDVETLVRAAALLKDEDIRIYIIGGGVFAGKLQKEAEGLSNVTFLPMQPPALAESIYAGADLNVISLLGGGVKTALPSKTATCLRAGRPILFSLGQHNRFAEAMSGFSGAVFSEPGDPEALAQSILAVKNRGAAGENRLFDFFRLNCRKEDNLRKYTDLLLTLAGQK